MFHMKILLILRNWVLLNPKSLFTKKPQKLSGYKPQEILFIDDVPANLMAAEKMGWHVLWFDDYRPTETANQIKPNTKILDY